MTRLSLEQVFNDNKTQDLLSITTLNLNHKALFDINCLAVFTNLEKLDLTFNNLTSLEGLKSCVNLKWLSVVQNKLLSLKGIEPLSKLTVLNAGKNKLQAIDEVISLVGLCALILNDNEIVSICKLHHMKNLNTLVLSRNPIHSIGDSLFKVKSIKKLSLSNCKLQSIDSSLKSCIELKELRLAHNDIKTLPVDLVHNKKLLNLDLGYNVIMRWSDLKVLNSLGNLRNLNLQGNPIAENAKLVKKIHKVLPGLRILNARPIDKNSQYEKGNTIDKDDDPAIKKLEIRNSKRDGKLEMDALPHLSSQGSVSELDHADDVDTNKKSKRKRQVMEKLIREKKEVPSLVGERDHVTIKNEKYNDSTTKDKSLKQKKPKDSDKHSLKEDPVFKETDAKVEKKQKKKAKKVGEGQVDVIDDTEASFAELFAGDGVEYINSNRGKLSEKAVEDMNLATNMTTSFVANRKESKKHSRVARLQLSPEVEIGMGGQSSWAD